MKVLIVSEGKHEGSGALQKLATRLAKTELDVTYARVSNPDIHVYHGKGRGYFKKALGWLRQAAKREHDALILVIDEDGKPERVEEIDQAQNTEKSRLPRAFGVAIRSFDAWMLADEVALTKVLGLQVQRQGKPEGEKHPKRRCEELLKSSSQELSQSEMYAALADCISIERLEERCPRGFGPFAERVRAL